MRNFFNTKENSLAFYEKLDYLQSTKIVLFVVLGILNISCNQKNNTKVVLNENQSNIKIRIPNFNVDKEQIKYDNKTSTFSRNEVPFSGYMVSFYQDSVLKEKIGILNGKKQNKSTYWFRNGKMKQVATYHNGKLHGEKKLWSNDSIYTLTAHLNYHFGKAHGEQKQWYKTGELYKKLNLSMGKEEGIQQAFRKNGDLYANYEAKNGRIFGMKKTSLCYGLKDQNLKKYEK
ncbi:toxin-antitoxin system YwqK family antitoxin [Aquimarina sp. SS2-1]|uniref:toxin-antitoxin system YwqK family antitoxin n=1 Tax=Aquimarina besae TaxID=3342247 RepID=UPI00366E96C7